MNPVLAEVVKSLSIVMEERIELKFPDYRQAEIASKIDHTLLRFDTHFEEIKKICHEALQFEFYAVCVPPYFVKKTAMLLKDYKTKIVSIAGFPLGYCHTPTKVEGVKRSIEEGADEIDMVMNIAAFKSGDLKFVENDIQSVTTLCHFYNKLVKIIIETGSLTQKEMIKACEICTKAEVDYVKTSTGFNDKGATVEAVKLMRKTLPDKIKIKAAGGIRTKDFAISLLAAGADRLGCSASVKIIT